MPELPESLDLASASVYFDNWGWFKIYKLPDGMEKCGLVSFGFYLMRRDVLDSICLTQWDELYSKDMISELRFPSIAHSSGYKVGAISLQNCSHGDVKVGKKRGIYHSVSYPVKEGHFSQ